MLVKTSKNGHTGLHIGEANARRYFSKGVGSIELKLDDLHIRCALPPEFWQDQPEIHDPRLSEWLVFKAGRRRVSRDPMFFSMLPAGAGTYVLRPRADAPNEALGAEVNRPRRVQPEPRLTPAFLLPSRSVA